MQLSSAEADDMSFRNTEWGPESNENMIKEIYDFATPNGPLGQFIDKTARERISRVFLEEKMFETWHHSRVILIGDAAHKVLFLLLKWNKDGLDKGWESGGVKTWFLVFLFTTIKKNLCTLTQFVWHHRCCEQDERTTNNQTPLPSSLTSATYLDAAKCGTGSSERDARRSHPRKLPLRDRPRRI